MSSTKLTIEDDTLLDMSNINIKKKCRPNTISWWTSLITGATLLIPPQILTNWVQSVRKLKNQMPNFFNLWRRMPWFTLSNWQSQGRPYQHKKHHLRVPLKYYHKRPSVQKDITDLPWNNVKFRRRLILKRPQLFFWWCFSSE